MAFVLSDRIKETTTTTGTGTYTLGGAVSGFETFTANLSNGDTTYYCCTDGTDFEVGLGTFTSSGTTLARTTIISSSNSNNAVSWSSGSRDIFCTLPGSKVLALNGSGNLLLENGAFIFDRGSSTDPTIHLTGIGPNTIRFHDGQDETNTTNAVDIAYRTSPNDLRIERSENGNIIAEFGGDDGHAALYHANSKKLETTSGGVTITGALTGNVTGDVTGNADTATALETARTIGGVSFDGTANINLPGVNTSGSQDTSGTATNATNVTVSANTGTDEDNRIPFVANASTSAGNHGLEMDTDSNQGLHYNPSSNTLTTTFFKSITSSGQANIIGTNSGGQLMFGMDGSFQNCVLILDDEDGQPIFTFQEEGAAGAGTPILDGGDTDVTSHKPFIANSTTTLNDDVTFTGTSANIVFDKSDNALEFADNAKAKFGTGDDLEIFHEGNHSFIVDNGTGDLYIRASDNLNIQSDNGSGGWQTSIQTQFTGSDNKVALFHGGTQVFSTRSNGLGFDVDGGVIFEGSTADANETLLTAADPTADRTITLPNATGTVFTSGNPNDITDIGIQAFDVVLGTGSDLKFEGATNNSNETTLTVVDPTADRTVTLPDATGTVLTTGNSDTPTTTTSSSDADFVLVDDGGTMKKITPSNLGITSGGASKGFAVAMAIAL